MRGYPFGWAWLIGFGQDSAILFAKNSLINTNIHWRRRKNVKVTYDPKADAAYIKFSENIPSGVVEISEGVNLDTTEANEVVGIEILDASKKIPVETLFNLESEELVTP